MSTVKTNTIDSLNGTDEISMPTMETRFATAWVNFNGTGTVAIRDSYNVSSITDNSTGNYTVNFTNTLANDDYALSGIVRRGSSNADNGLFMPVAGTYSTSAVQVLSQASSVAATPLDCDLVCVIIHGGN